MVNRILGWFGYRKVDAVHDILVNRIIQAGWEVHFWLASDGDMYNSAKYLRENRPMLDLEDSLHELKDYEEITEAGL